MIFLDALGSRTAYNQLACSSLYAAPAMTGMNPGNLSTTMADLTT